MGEWEGRPLAQISAAHPEEIGRLFNEPQYFSYPGGESFAEFRDRVAQALRTIRSSHETGDVAVVTHGGVVSSDTRQRRRDPTTKLPASGTGFWLHQHHRLV